MTKIIFFSKCFQIMLPLRHASLVLQLQVHWPSFELPAPASAFLRLFLALGQFRRRGGAGELICPREQRPGARWCKRTPAPAPL